MLQTFKNGQTSIVLRTKLLDSSSTTGAGLTGLTSASGSLIISTIADNEATATTYTQAGSTIESITTLGTFAAPTATKCRFKEVDSTNHKGIYEFQFADARFAVSSAKSLLVSVLGATNLQQADFVIQLQSDDPFVAKPTNSNLLSIDASGRVDVIKINGTSQTARDIGASVLLSTGTGTGQLDFTSGVVKANATQWLGGTIPAVNVTGVPLVDLKYTLGTISPAAAGSVAIDWAQVSNKTSTVALTNTTVGTATTVTNQLTAAAIATGVWTDTTAGDFTTALSVGKSVMNGVSLGTGLTVASVSGAVGSVTGLTASNLDATISSRMATYTQPTGFLAATFPAGTVANTTNITAGVMTTTTNLTTNNDKTGYTLTAGYDLAKTASQAGDAMALTGAERNSTADALLDRAAGVETGQTFRQAMRIMLAALAGKASGLATTTAVYRDTNDSKDRISATVDADGNRSAVTLDAT